jgi:hypothetical protein
MKILFTAAILLTLTTKAFAASSFCEVFITDSNDPEKRYETVITCDGKQGAINKFDDLSIGTVAPFTQAVSSMLAKGYSVVNCSGTGVNQACYLQK